MLKSKTLVSIIIPVYNEAKTVKEALNNVYQHRSENFDKEIVIVESNSTDGSREIVKNFVKGKKNITLILENTPNGKGHAVQEGIKKAKGEVILIQDADLEYKVQDYDIVLEPILTGKASFVLGSRHLNEHEAFTWRIRKFKGIEIPYAYMMNFAGIIIHGIFNTLYGTNLTDPTTMYKVFTKKLYNQITPKGRRFDFDWELVCKFVRLGYVPLEVPINYDSRSPREGKKIGLFKDGYSCLKTVVKYRFADKKTL